MPEKFFFVLPHQGLLSLLVRRHGIGVELGSVLGRCLVGFSRFLQFGLMLRDSLVKPALEILVLGRAGSSM